MFVAIGLREFASGVVLGRPRKGDADLEELSSEAVERLGLDPPANDA